MRSYKKLIKIVKEFQKLPKGYFIENPNDVIEVDVGLPYKLRRLINCDSEKIYFTRKTLKHVAEKHNAAYLLAILQMIIKNLEFLYKGKIAQRYVITKVVDDPTYTIHAATLEVIEKSHMIIVTVFRTDESYLKNFEILWSAGALSER